MRERPILFSGPMVRAILDGRKTQTRRVVKLPASYEPGEVMRVGKGSREVFAFDCDPGPGFGLLCPYGEPGDQLWVRETFCHEYDPATDMPTGGYLYRADGNDVVHAHGGERAAGTERSPWKPSIHMPRAASRITLEVTGVRVQRVQEITSGGYMLPSDISKEGCPPELSPRGIPNDMGAAEERWWIDLWNRNNAARGFSWESNPWVWVVEFNRVTP